MCFLFRYFFAFTFTQKHNPIKHLDVYSKPADEDNFKEWYIKHFFQMDLNVYSKTSRDTCANECCWFSLSSPVLPMCSVINQSMWIIQLLWFSGNIHPVSILAFSLFSKVSERAKEWIVLTEFNIWQQIRNTT